MTNEFIKCVHIQYNTTDFFLLSNIFDGEAYAMLSLQIYIISLDLIRRQRAGVLSLD